MLAAMKRIEIMTKTITHIWGYPRIGEQRELKFAQECMIFIPQTYQAKNGWWL